MKRYKNFGIVEMLQNFYTFPKSVALVDTYFSLIINMRIFLVQIYAS